MINVGIVGLGQSGWHLHAAPLHSFPDYEVVAVSDQSAALRERAAEEFGAKTYSEPKALYADPDVQLVVIAIPNNLHATHAIAALQAGKHVVCEKPMAATLDEADEMVAAAESTGRVLTVFHNRRWDADFRMLKAVVERDLLGDVLTLDSRIYMAAELWGLWGSYGVPEFRPQWRTEAAYGGGYLADWGPHMVDQILDLTGEWPVSVTGSLRSDIWCEEVDDYYTARLTFPSGLLVTLEASNNGRIAPPRWFVVGKKGTLTSPGGFAEWSDIRVRAEIDGIVAEMFPKEMGAGAELAELRTGGGLAGFFYTDLAEALETGRPPAITADHARNVMVILDAIRRSDAAGETVYLE
jgi:predicted dehydrogenase